VQEAFVGSAGPDPKVLAIVPTLDWGSARLARLIRSVEDLQGSDLLHLVVVVNTTSRYHAASSDAPDIAVRWTRLETGLNLGFAGSIVFASGLFPAAHVWALQDDLELDSGCLMALIGELESRADLGAVSPTVVTPAGIVPRATAGGILDADGRVASMLPTSDVGITTYKPDDDVDFIPSRGMLIRGEAWAAIGGMDPSFYPVGWTDVDLCARLRSRGWMTASSASATVQHAKAASTPQALGSITYRRNRELFRAKQEGALVQPTVHPDIPRELLETIAREASSLAFALSEQFGLRFAIRQVVRSWAKGITRLARRIGPTPR